MPNEKIMKRRQKIYTYIWFITGWDMHDIENPCVWRENDSILLCHINSNGEGSVAWVMAGGRKAVYEVLVILCAVFIIFFECKLLGESRTEHMWGIVAGCGVVKAHD